MSAQTNYSTTTWLDHLDYLVPVWVKLVS